MIETQPCGCTIKHPHLFEEIWSHREKVKRVKMDVSVLYILPSSKLNDRSSHDKRQAYIHLVLKPPL